MRATLNFLFKIILLTLCFCGSIALADKGISIPILCYHNFDPTKPGSMTISTQKFAAQLKWLRENGYTFIPLKEWVDYVQGKRASLPPKPVVITIDDGRESVYQYVLPLVHKYHFPVTLFIYPLVISHARYALTWEQLKELQKTGLFDIESHTYWHPNFKQEKKRLSLNAYEKLVHAQLFGSKKILEEKMGTKITLLAWPYGIYNQYLEDEAAKAGYVMAFSIDGRPARKSDKRMAAARFMIVDGLRMKTFATMMKRS